MSHGKRRYLTSYIVGKSEYGGDVWANSFRHAQGICKRRGIGETVIGSGYRGGGLRRPVTREQKIHEAVYLGWIALEMGLMTPAEVLGDQGIVHELVHRAAGSKAPGIEKRFRDLQKLIPGHRP